MVLKFLKDFLFKNKKELPNILKKTNYFGEELKNSFKLEEFFKSTSGHKATQKYKSVKAYLMKSFLNENSIDRFDLESFDPVKTAVEKLNPGQKNAAVEKLYNKILPQKHLDLETGALGCFFKAQAEAQEQQFIPFGTLIYLTVLKNKINYLVKEREPKMSSKEQEGLKDIGNALSTILTTQEDIVNASFQKTKLKNQLWGSKNLNPKI